MVLYRENWGKTKWTRVEENAIKDRCFNKGFNFLLFVPLEKNDLPVWIPETLIYYDYQNFGLKNLIPVLHSHLKRNGVEEQKDDLDGLVSKIDDDLSYQKKLESYVWDEQSVQDFKNGVRKFKESLSQKAESLTEKYENIHVSVKEERDHLRVIYNGNQLVIYHRLGATNTIRKSYIRFRLMNGIHTGYHDLGTEPKLIREKEYTPSIDRLGNFVWKLNENKNFTTGELLEKHLKELINSAPIDQ
ncbi:MAG TPA: hypothetical protein VF181_00930 [Balneolaceae bacterium]